MPSVIRLVYMLRRKPGLSLEEFHRVWRDEHGPLVAFHQVRLGILRYTQSHRLDDPSTAGMTGPRGMKPPLRRCGRSVVGVGGGADRCVGERRRQRAAAEVAADEAGFIDLPASPLWLAHEYPQVNPGPEPLVATPKSPLVKLHYPLRLLPTLTFEQAQIYWRTRHGPLARRTATMRGTLRYIQVYRYESAFEAAQRESRGTTVEPYIRHAEAWIDRSVHQESPEVAGARQVTSDDVAKFIDDTRSARRVGKEQVLIDRWY